MNPSDILCGKGLYAATPFTWIIFESANHGICAKISARMTGRQITGRLPPAVSKLPRNRQKEIIKVVDALLSQAS